MIVAQCQQFTYHLSLVAENYVTTGEIARELGYSRQRVDTIIRQAADFPKPDVVLTTGVRLWKRKAALQWFADHPRRHYRRAVKEQATPRTPKRGGGG
jgi:hypothetical protein